MLTKTNAKPRRTKRACAQRARKLKRSGDPKAASRLARYCPPPGRRKPNGRVRPAQREAARRDSDRAMPVWRQQKPPGTIIYGVLRKEFGPTDYRSARAEVQPVYVAVDGIIRHVPDSLSVRAGFEVKDPQSKTSRVVFPNAAGSFHEYLRAIGEELHGNPDAFVPYPGTYL